MAIYKLDNDIKVPIVVARGGNSNKPSRVARTLAAMSQGQSFLIKDELEALKALKIVKDYSARERARGGSRQFVARRVNKGYLRIWRVK